MIDQIKHNGWANYATWRVQLELWDGYDWTESDYRDGTGFSSPHDLADYLKDATIEFIENSFNQDSSHQVNTVSGWAVAFIDDVNWIELAENIDSQYPDVVKPNDDEAK